MNSRRVLYKYVSVDRAVQILKTKSIRFSQANALNDAFELIPSLDIDKIKGGYLETFTDAKDLFGLDNFTLGVTYSLLSEYESVGLLCLSENFDVPLMWAHYADNYKGVVIGFDIEQGLLVNHDPSDVKNFCISANVNYSENRFKYPNSGGEPLKYMFHKDSCWKYENEWRIVRGLNALSNIGNNIFLSGFNTVAVRCIIFGPLVEHPSIHKILDALREDDYSHVGRYISYLSDHKFEIDIAYLTSMFSDESEMVYNKEELRLRRFRDNMLSKGMLFKAMEVLDINTKFSRSKDHIDLY